MNVIFRLPLFTFVLFFVSGCGGGSSSNVQSNNQQSDEQLNSGTSLTYDDSSASSMSSSTEFRNFNYSNAASTQNPLEVINAHKAYGYGLTGNGKIIAIMDTGFSTSHQELDTKTVTTYGTLTTATGTTATKDHGLIVSSIAAAEDDGSGMQGVAPSASLHLSSFNKLNGNTFYPTHWSNATNDASTAVVQNNSWGVDYQVNSLQSDISSGWNWSGSSYCDENSTYKDLCLDAIKNKWNAAGLTSDRQSTGSYIDALNNFQEHGVIVYAMSNDSTFTDSDYQAALPVLFSELDEAWITGVNVEITGSSGNETYTRKSAPCGSTASYCLGADGFELAGAAYDASSTSMYWNGVSGTSFVAPQISGAVALLYEAFPNHSASQITDRLLASADNSFFSHTDAVTFGNGVEHGYDTEFGHGILDIYTALNPITSSSYTRIFTGGSTQDSNSYQTELSSLSTSRSFGDSVLKGLQGEVGYMYDDLDGGFDYDLGYHIDIENSHEQALDVSSELANIEIVGHEQNTQSWKIDFDNVISSFSPNKDSQSVLTLGSSSLPVQSFFSPSFDNSIDLTKHSTEFLDPDEGGIGIGSVHRAGDSRILLGLTTPININNEETIGSRSTLSASFEYVNSDSATFALMTGITQENDSLLGSTGTDAFTLTGSKSNTTFAALKAQAHLSNNITLTGIGTIARSNMTSPSNSFINSADNVESNSLSFIANKGGLFGDDNLSLYLSQPNRINDGSMSIKLASLARGSGEISYTNKDVNLEPSGRQLDVGLSYKIDYNDELGFAIKHLFTNDNNHTSNSSNVSSSFIGLKYKDLKLGLATSTGDHVTNIELSYSSAF